MKRLILLAAATVLLASPALADTAAPAAAAASSVTDLIVTAVLAAIPGIVLSGWAWLKSHAAQSAAAWDDEAVAFVEKIAQGVVDKKAAP